MAEQTGPGPGQGLSQMRQLLVKKSDGVKEVNGRLNGPTTEQLTRKTDANRQQDFYRVLPPMHETSLIWRHQLGMLLKLSLNVCPEEENPAILVAFPRNYILYEHVVKDEDELTDIVVGANEEENGEGSGGGPNDRNETREMSRSDAYLYGHPYGPEYRYSSPLDFLPHLIWLSQNRSDDHDTCSCKMCSPEEIEDVIKEEGGSVEMMAHVRAHEELLSQRLDDTQVAHAAKLMLQAKGVEDADMRNLYRAAAVGALTAYRTGLIPTPLPSASLMEQRLDTEGSRFIYRIGEVIWFAKMPGLVWIGVIINRQLRPSSVAAGKLNPRYLIMPLSYKGAPEKPRIVDNEEQIRPWLGYEAHPIQHRALVGKDFHEINWAEVAAGKFGPGDPGVDGSVIGASTVEKTYTVIHPLPSSHTGQPSPIPGATFWNGIFVGAEKFWVGEPVRLLNPAFPGKDVMVIHAIMEYPETITTTDASSNPGETKMAIKFQGDIYNMISRAYTTEAAAIPSTHPSLPPRMTTEINERNAVRGITRLVFQWTLVRSLATVELGAVNGRWYESRIAILYRLLQANISSENVHDGIVYAIRTMPAGGTVAAGLNNRKLAGKGNQEGGSGLRKMTREEAMGETVPPETWFRKGFDGPEGERLFPDEGGVD
ncbi:MAG: hypothetical protein M1823_005233 [Watsoniomyces obsoletus]|nr:MAG: hypothetical protein M1823_005233 [Watsoniomyces obsoletus]